MTEMLKLFFFHFSDNCQDLESGMVLRPSLSSCDDLVRLLGIFSNEMTESSTDEFTLNDDDKLLIFELLEWEIDFDL